MHRGGPYRPLINDEVGTHTHTHPQMKAVHHPPNTKKKATNTRKTIVSKKHRYAINATQQLANI